MEHRITQPCFYASVSVGSVPVGRFDCRSCLVKEKCRKAWPCMAESRHITSQADMDQPAIMDLSLKPVKFFCSTKANLLIPCLKSVYDDLKKISQSKFESYV